MREATPVDAPTIPDLLRARAAQTPDGLAFVVEDSAGPERRLTWGQFAASVERLAASLRELRLAPGERVGILAPTSVEWELAQLASLACGAVVAGIDPNYLDAELNEVVGQLGLSGLFVGEPAMLARLASQHRKALRITVSFGSREPELAPTLKLDELLDDAPVPAVSRGLAAPGDDAVLTLSSGTTGKPKPIVYTHAQVLMAVRAIVGAFPDVGAGSRLLCWLPLANLFQRMIDFCAIAGGATSYVIAEPREVMTHLSAARPQLFIGVPRFFERVHAGLSTRMESAPWPIPALVRWAIDQGRQRARADEAGEKPGALGRARFWLAEQLALRRLRSIFGGEIRYLVSGSAPMPGWLLEWFDALGLPVYEAYGVSENVVPVAMNRPGARRSGTVGKPMPGNEVKLGADGEVMVRGPGVFRGYLDAGSPLPGADGFWATGDLGELTPEGYLRLTGRKSDAFKTSGGRWIVPANVEAMLRRLPYVEHAVLLGGPDGAPVAILNVDRDRFRRHAPGSTGGASHSPELGGEDRARMARDAAECLASLPGYTQPVGLLVVTEPFSIAGGELTTNLKLRRTLIAEKFRTQVERLRGAAPGPSLSANGTAIPAVGVS
ncbi:MAG: AMP-dependent synthetase/ligase [Candidatus Rokuibacteriota bacterium]